MTREIETMAEYIDHRTGLLMKQTTVYIPDELLKWARGSDVKLGKILTNAIIEEKRRIEEPLIFYNIAPNIVC